MSDTSITKIILRHGSQDDLNSLNASNNQLALGEPGFVTDDGDEKFYIGKGPGAVSYTHLTMPTTPYV